MAYAEAIKARQVAMDGKPAWPIFMRTWPKYVHEAATDHGNGRRDRFWERGTGTTRVA